MKTIEERFWEKVDKRGDDECWEWKNGRSSYGYGSFWLSGHEIPAHRISWILNNGKIPSELWVLHHCDNPPCVNPKHLFLGTHLDNMRDKASKGRCKSGKHNSNFHPEINLPKPKLTKELVKEIRTIRNNSGLSEYKIAKIYNVSRSAIHAVIIRLTWRQD